MAAKSPVRQNYVSRIAAIERHNGPDDPRLEPLRAELATEGLAEHIKRVVDGMPPLTDGQLSRLAVLLNGGRSA
jgi:hypothetical protein